jgi:hypothetical protein
MKVQHLTHEFVESVPQDLEPAVLYISMNFATTLHLCCCGCGNEVVLPLKPSAWQLTFDGKSISLSPSVGNWSFPCRSHYWIDRGRVRPARKWSRAEVEANRRNNPPSDTAPPSNDRRPSRSSWRQRARRALGQAFGRK